MNKLIVGWISISGNSKMTIFAVVFRLALTRHSSCFWVLVRLLTGSDNLFCGCRSAGKAKVNLFKMDLWFTELVGLRNSLEDKRTIKIYFKESQKRAYAIVKF